MVREHANKLHKHAISGIAFAVISRLAWFDRLDGLVCHFGLEFRIFPSKKKSANICRKTFWHCSRCLEKSILKNLIRSLRPLIGVAIRPKRSRWFWVTSADGRHCEWFTVNHGVIYGSSVRSPKNVLMKRMTGALLALPVNWWLVPERAALIGW